MSRYGGVGVQKYLPDEAHYHFESLGVGGTTNTLSTTKPWYSLYGNDLFKPTVYSNTLDTATSSTAGLGINSHVLGKRQYELTNHLGNVQSTVLDRATPVIKQQDTSVIGYHSDISLAHDYYPFGMLMPGRYVSDTGQKCVTINTSILVPVIVRVYLDGISVTGYHHGNPNTVPVHNLPVALLASGEHPYVYHYNDAGTHPNGEVVTGELVEGRAEYGISLSEEPSGGVTAYFVIHPDTSQTEQELGFDLTLPEDCYMRMRVRQYTGTGEEYDEAVSWTSVDMSGAQQLLVPMDKPATAAGGKTILELEFNSSAGGNFPAYEGPNVYIRNYYTKITHYVPTTRIAYVCDEKDNYRFGVNGQEKDNEAKGIGNSLDFGARIYDSRLGRFLSLDPDRAKYPFQSPYLYANNTPIQAVDKEGKGAGHAALLFLAKQTNSTIAVGTSASVSYGVGGSVAAGIAVDPKGNVALFSSATLGSIDNTVFNIDRIGLGASINGNMSVMPFKDVSVISGAGFSVGASFYSPKLLGGGLSADFSVSQQGNVSFQGFTASIGLGTPGGSVGFGGVQATNAILLSKGDYEAIFDGEWDSRGANTAMDWTRGVNEDLGNPSGFWEYTGKEMVFSPIEGEKCSYSVSMRLNYSYSTSGKGAKEGQKNDQTSQTIETGITIRKKDEFTYKSDNVKE